VRMIASNINTRIDTVFLFTLHLLSG
jgi:hypothetical protein